jgi:hypothetical protein
MTFNVTIAEWGEHRGMDQFLGGNFQVESMLSKKP